MTKPVKGRTYLFFGDPFIVEAFDGETVDIRYTDTDEYEEMDIENWDEDVIDGCIETVALS